MTQVFYQCMANGCGLRTPYRTGRLERYCGACGGRLTPRIERSDERSRALRSDNIALLPAAAPSADLLAAVAEEVKRYTARRRGG